MTEEIQSMESEKWKEILLLSKFGVNEIETKLSILNQEFQFMHNYNPIEYITSRLKEPKEIERKLLRLGFEPTAENARLHLHDIGGVRVVCSFIKDVYALAKLLEEQSDIQVVEIKDYIKTPKANGYRSLHVLLKVPVFLSDKINPTIVEVQLRTTGMDLWASIEHKIYYKSDIAVPKEILDRLKQCAQVLSLLDGEMTSIKEDIEKLIQ